MVLMRSMRSMRSMGWGGSLSIVVVLVLLLLSPLHALEIQSEYTNLYVTQDNSRLVKNRTVTIRCTQHDASGTLLIGGVHNLTVTCHPPLYTYRKRLAGWVPEETQTIATSVCMMDNPFGASTAPAAAPAASSSSDPGILDEEGWHTLPALQPLLQRMKEVGVPPRPPGAAAKAGGGTGGGGRMKLQIFGALAAATGIDCLFGGCSGITREEFDNQVDRIDALMEFRNRTQAWRRISDQLDERQNAALRLAAEINGRQDSALETLQSQTDQIRAMMQETGKYVDVQLANLQADTRTLATTVEQTAQNILTQSQSGDELLLRQMNAQDQVVVGALEAHANVTRAQFMGLNQKTRALTRSVRDVLATVYDMYSNRDFRRQQTRLVWDAMDTLRAQGLEPFVDTTRPAYAGQRPVLRANWQQTGGGDNEGELPVALRNVYVDKIWVNFLTNAAAGTNAQIVSHEIVLTCSTQWALSFARTWNEYQDVMERIGPASCDPTRPRETRCVCWIEVQTTSCSRSPAAEAAGWTWSGGGTATDDPSPLLDPGSEGPCTSGTWTQDPAASPSHIFSLAAWHTWLQTQCQVPIAGTYTIYSERMNTVSAIAYNADVCALDVEQFLYNPPTEPTLPFTVYELWKESFRMMVLQLPALDRQVYGWLPQGLVGIRSPLAYLANGTSAVCDVQVLQGVSPVPLRVTELALQDVDTTVTVARTTPTSSADTDLVTETVLSVPFASALPPASASSQLGSLTAASTHVYDLPLSMSQLSQGRAGAAGFKDQPAYFLFPPTVPSVTSYEAWTGLYGETFYDPRDGMVGAQSFRRSVEGDGGGSGSGAPQRCGHDEGDAGTFGMWCTLLDHFRVHPLSNADRLVLQPEEWSYITTVHIPEGDVLQLRVSACPTWTYELSATRAVELLVTNPLVSDSNTVRLSLTELSCGGGDMDRLTLTLRPQETIRHRVPPPCTPDATVLTVRVERWDDGTDGTGGWTVCDGSTGGEGGGEGGGAIAVPSESDTVARRIAPTASDMVVLSHTMQSDVSLRFTTLGMELTKMMVQLMDFVRPDNTYAMVFSNSTLSVNETLAVLQAQYDSTRRNLTESVQVLLTQGLLTNVTGPNATLSHLLEPYLEQMRNDSDVITGLLANNSLSLIEFDELLDHLDNLTESRANLTDEFQALIDEQDKKFATFDATKSCKPNGNPLSWFAAAGCGMGKVTSSVLGTLTGGFGGIGDFFLGPLKTLFTMAMYVLLVYGLVVLGRFLLRHHQKRKRSRGQAYDELQEAEAEAEAPRVTVTPPPPGSPTPSPTNHDALYPMRHDGGGGGGGSRNSPSHLLRPRARKG